jgi:hypothetical protein
MQVCGLTYRDKRYFWGHGSVPEQQGGGGGSADVREAGAGAQQHVQRKLDRKPREEVKQKQKSNLASASQGEQLHANQQDKGFRTP